MKNLKFWPLLILIIIENELLEEISTKKNFSNTFAIEN